MNIPLSNPDITQKEIEAVTGVLRTPYLSLGPKLDEFERKFAKYVGTKYAIAVNSGTSGLHLSVRALDIKDGDEVITSSFSFVSSANCVLFERAKPVFVDIRPDTFNINEDLIEAKITKRTKAILPVHVFGYPCNIDKIVSIARKHKLSVIEDACEAIGAKLNSQKVGTFGDIGVFGFYPNKQMTTGEGGMVVTNDRKIADSCESMRNQGRDDGSKWLEHNRLGFNYRLSEINCALGIVQLERINELLKKRERVAGIYNSELSGIAEIILPVRNTVNIKRSWFVYTVLLNLGFSASKRNNLVGRLRDLGIGSSIYFPSIHLQPFYRKTFGFKKGTFPVTESVSNRSFALPFYGNLGEKAIKYIAGQLRRAIKEIK